MVWSRWGRRLPSQPLISRSTSDSVRYSRVRTSAFLGRRGVSTFRIWVSGDTIFKAGFAIWISAPIAMTFGKVVEIRKVKVTMGHLLDKPPIEGGKKGP